MCNILYFLTHVSWMMITNIASETEKTANSEMYAWSFWRFGYHYASSGGETVKSHNLYDFNILNLHKVLKMGEWMVKWFHHNEIWRLYSCGNCQISKKSDNYKPKPHGFKISRDLMIKMGALSHCRNESYNSSVSQLFFPSSEQPKQHLFAHML